MLWWLVDNVFLVVLCCGMVALCFGVAWWTNRNNKLLIGFAVPVVLAVLAWLLSLFIVTDRMQLVRNVEAIADLINAGKLDEALQHFDEEVTIDTSVGAFTKKRAELRTLATGNMKAYGVKTLLVAGISVEEVSRPNAKVRFFVGPEEGPERGLCKAEFLLNPDGKWRVKKLTVENPFALGQKALFPIFGK